MINRLWMANMLKTRLRPFFLVIGLAAIPITSLGETPQTILSSVSKRLGADSLKTLRYSGSGSSYLVRQGPAPAGGWNHAVMKSYTCELNLHAVTARVQIVRATGTPLEDQIINRSIDPASPWSSQYEFWITPYGFIKAAMDNKGTTFSESKTVFGTPYRTVTVILPGNHKLVGYINDKDMIEKVDTWVGDQADVPVEVLYRDYKEFDNVEVPTMIVRKEAGELSLIAVVTEVTVGK
jgi:hypothetical protein